MTDDPTRPIAIDAYDTMADAYADRVEEKPFNADLERPATRSLLPPLDGLSVLDAGCGPGVTTADLVDCGARVVGLDASSRMLAHARRRLEGRAALVRADLEGPLPFGDCAFDLVHSSLAFDYVRDWDRLFAELSRVLNAGGQLIFSAQHPVAETQRIEPDDYFAVEPHTDEWTGFGAPVDVTFYRRPLGTMVTPLVDAGFHLEGLVEARPTETFRGKDPELYEDVVGRPTFLSLRARLAD